MFEELNRAEQRAFDALSLALVLFNSYSAVLDPAASQYHRGIYVLFTYVLVFLLYRSASRLGRTIDYPLMAASVVCIVVSRFRKESGIGPGRYVETSRAGAVNS